MISPILNALGLMKRSEHEEIVADNDEKAYTAWAKMANERDDMKMYRDDWQQKHNSVVGKLKRATTDLAKQAEEIEAYKEGAKALSRIIDSGVEEIKAQQGLVSALTEKNVELVSKLETARRECDALRHDANMWRNSLKRSRDRKKGVGRG